ncbi:MAG: PAS domain S-box protein [Patescibacteria group bacterium]|nr:PAS domain S-box protein [Patescibacteria group bacterium]
MPKQKAKKFNKRQPSGFAGKDLAGGERDFCQLVRWLFENSPSAVFLERLDGKIIDCNRAACKMLGYKRDELLSMNAGEIVPKKDAKEIFPKLIKNLLNKGSAAAQSKNIRKDGTVFPVEAFFKLTRQTGEPIVFLTVRDISHHKEVEKQIKAEKERMELYLNLAGVMMVAIDKQGKITLINKKGNEILGYKKNFLLKKDWFTTCLPEKNREEVRRVFKKCMAGKVKSVERYVNHVMTKSGEERLISWHNSVLRDKDKKIIGSLSSGEDITERARIGEDLSHIRVLYTSLVENSNDGVVVLQDGFVKFFNNQMFNMVGYTEVEAYSKPFLNFVADKYKKAVYEKYKAKISGQKTTSRYEIELIKKDGKSLPVEINSSPIFFEGRPAVMSIIRDMTKAKEIDKMKSEFVSVASHQLRTPLTGIKWFSELLLRDKASVLSKEQKDYASQISIGVARAISLVDDLLDVSHIEAGEKYNVVLKTMDLSPVIKGVVEEKAVAARNKEITVALSKECLKETLVKADKNKIFQAFMNLLDNAVKYTPRGGKITIGREETDGRIIYFVKDNGVGIPAHQINRVFDKFFRAENVLTLHTDGTGLGLYIVKAIVEAHNGKVWFESPARQSPGERASRGGGTTFFVSLPLAEAKEGEGAKPPV